jgi:hypothetical protein
MYAIRDIEDGAIHSSRYYSAEDAESALCELAYELDCLEGCFEVCFVADC